MRFYTGMLHAWNDEKGFGFIKPADGGKNIFIHIRNINSGSSKPNVGDMLTYRIAQDGNGKVRACEASILASRFGHSNSPTTVLAWQRGILRSWNDRKGFGFIRPQDNGKEVFVHIKDFKDDSYRPIAGATVYYRVRQGDDGRANAYDVMVKEEEHKNVIRKTSMARWLLAASPFLLSSYALYKSHSPAPLLAYGVMGSISFLQYSVDKSRATTGKWRISEKALHLCELLGGWPGALVAQSEIRHKTNKAPYQAVFWLIIIAHTMIWLDYLFFYYIPFDGIVSAI